MAIRLVSLLDEEVVPLSSSRGRSPSALGSRRSWPSGPRPEQEKTESCLPRKKNCRISSSADICRAHRSHYFSSHWTKQDVSFKAKRLKDAAKTHTQLPVRPEEPRRLSHRKWRTELLLPFGSADATDASETLCVRR